MLGVEWRGVFGCGMEALDSSAALGIAGVDYRVAVTAVENGTVRGAGGRGDPMDSGFRRNEVGARLLNTDSGFRRNEVGGAEYGGALRGGGGC